MLYFYAGFLAIEMQDWINAKDITERALLIRPDSAVIKILNARCIGYSGNYLDATNYLIEIQNQNNNLSSKWFKVSSTLLIDFYSRWAEYERNINKNLNGCLSKIELGFEVFDKVINKNEVDSRLNEELANLLNSYLFTLRLTNTPDYKIGYDKYLKYHTYINRTRSFSQIEHAINRYFIQKEPTPLNGDSKLYYGNVIQFFQGKTFAFIESDFPDNIYLNYEYLLSPAEWERICNGTKVSFNVKDGEKGPYAVNVKVC